MAAGTIPVRTPQGQAEIGMRRLAISQRHRTVLFLIDGRRRAAEVQRMAQLAGVPASCLDDLIAMGLVMLAEPTVAMPRAAATAEPDVLHIDLPLDSVGARADSLLPPVRTLAPESVSADSALASAPPLDSWLPSQGADSGLPDAAFVEARLILLRAVRAEAPITGSLTLLRLRRARGRADLTALLDEVEARITKPHRALAAAQTLRRVRLLLEGRLAPSLAAA